MRHKICDAYKQYKETEYDCNKVWRTCKRIIPICIRTQFNNLWKTFIGQFRKRVRNHYKDKSSWLIKKWTPEPEKPPADYNGIRLVFTELEEEFTSNPRTYGEVLINHSEEELLKLPPKFGIYSKIKTVDCMIEAEKALTKLRWTNMCNKKDDAAEAAGDTDKSSANQANMLFDKATKQFDINKLKVTDLPYNPSVMMPKADNKESEIKYQQFKNEVRTIASDLSNKTNEWSNLLNSEKDGLRSIKCKIKDRELICYQTDKSGRWSCDSESNYIKACEKHIINNESISEKTAEEQSEAERSLNCHSLAILRMLGIDDKNRRLKNAIISHGNVIPPMYCLRKDHKAVEIGKETEGPKTRPVCAANDCQTRRLSYILCLILKELIPYHETEINATDELLQAIEVVNEGEVKPDWTVGSLDVEALYPSLDIRKCAKVVADNIYDSELVFPKLKWKEIALYLKYHLSNDETCTLVIEPYLPKRKSRGKNPIFECSGSKSSTVERYAPWIFSNVEPSEAVLRRMFCNSIEIIINKSMSLHDFTFNGKIYRQERGGAIGLDLAGVVASIYMNWWDRKFLQILHAEEIVTKMYKRYVDDINLILEVPNTELNNEEEVMQFIQMKANTIDKSIQVTYDYSSKYDDRRLPVLDVKVWIGLCKDGKYRILHTHYIKDVSSRLLIHSRSAHAPGVKFNVCVNEAIRIFRNCSSHIEWEECKSHLEYFAKRLLFSGYDTQYRYNVLKSAHEKFSKMKSEFNIDGRFYQNLIERRNSIPNKKNKKSNWFSRSGKYKSVMFVDATQNSELKNRIQKSANKNKIPIKVIEKVNNSIKRNIQKNNPFPILHCGREDCIMCKLQCKTSCRIRGIVYQLDCSDCNKILYRGQSARSGYERINEHFLDWAECKSRKKNVKKSVLWEHSNNSHNCNDFSVSVKIISRNFGDPMKRLITESVMIEELDDEEILNSKKEWSYIRLPKASITT